MPFESFQIRVCSNYSTSIIMLDILLIDKGTGTFVVLGTTITTQEVGALYVFPLFLSFPKGGGCLRGIPDSCFFQFFILQIGELSDALFL